MDILIVEDDDLMARALARRLRGFGEVCAAGSLASARANLPTLPNLGAAVLDWRLPDGTCMELLDHLCVERSIPCMVLTGALDGEIVNSVQAVGAEIAIKPEGLVNVDAFLRRVQSRDRAIEIAMADYVALWGLTRRHREILRSATLGVNRRELAKRLWIAEGTLKAHIRVMRQRTGADSLAAMVQEVLLRALHRDGAGQGGPPTSPPERPV